MFTFLKYKSNTLKMAIKNFVPVLFTKSQQLNQSNYFNTISFIVAKEGYVFKSYLESTNSIYSTSNGNLVRCLTKVAKENELSKSKLIEEMNFKCEQDALPFYKLPVKTLLKIYKTTKNDEKSGYCKNRLYFISDRIKCEPSVLSTNIVKRTFIYKLSFNWLENSLKVLLDMNVPGDRILRDLWVLKYNHETIQSRLEKVKSMGVDPLYPWMVRCSENILNRSIQISQETKSILGDEKSIKMYLANRLNISPEAIEDMYTKVPALKTTRAAKVKNFLDFLIEQGFSVDEIKTKVRILTASQNTVKQRLNKLRSLGLSEINLNVLCRSRKHFKKYCESIESVTKEQA